MRLGDLDEALRMIKDSRTDNPFTCRENSVAWIVAHDSAISCVKACPTIDAVPVTEIKAYLQKRLDEWNALGDRKFEPANMWGYNFIMACFDDLERREGDG